MRRAVFLDRDGVVVREVGNLSNIAQLRLIPYAVDGIRNLNFAGFAVFIITNQPVVGRGWITEEELSKIHEVLLRRLARRGAQIDALYYCPHHPSATLIKYRKDCRDRKPNIGLIEKAVKNFNIQLAKSFLVGDSTRDIKTAINAGITSILVKTGYGGKDGKFDVKPNYVAGNLMDAVKIIGKGIKN